MKIGLYIEHGVGNGVGGAELMMTHLASAWSIDHTVDLIHHRPTLTKARLASFTDDPLERVHIRCVPREPEPWPHTNPLRRYRDATRWHEGLSAPYDVFVNCTHWLPAFNHAKRGVLLVLFPFYVRPPDTIDVRRLPEWKQLRHRTYYDIEWRRRLATYSRCLAISRFAQDWAHRRWGLTSDVVYPAVVLDRPAGPKEDLILSVGRFSTMAHTKKQAEMMEVFVELNSELNSATPGSTSLTGWTYASVGGLNDREENRRYFERVRAIGKGHRTIVEANVPRDRMRELFGRARVFWHATGLNEDTDSHPELAEHFGIATVEAMAAGCVPVVINKGGQGEIVEHGRSGFVWNTIDELKSYTRRLASDQVLWTGMSAEARNRAARFSLSRFIESMSRACNVAMSDNSDISSGSGVSGVAAPDRRLG